jgi:hypothetical protein
MSIHIIRTASEVKEKVQERAFSIEGYCLWEVRYVHRDLHIGDSNAFTYG